MSYIGWKTCYLDKESGCSPSSLNGLSFPELRVIAITNDYSGDSETVTAIHEMGHMVGIIDHYDVIEDNEDFNLTLSEAKARYNDPAYSEVCLYGTNGYTESNPADIVICQGCRNRVEEYREQMGN